MKLDPMSREEGAMLTEVTKTLNSIDNDKLQLAAENMAWGTYGPNGDEPIKKRFLNDLTTDHLENILVTQSHIGMAYRKVILFLLRKRYREEIVTLYSAT